MLRRHRLAAAAIFATSTTGLALAPPAVRADDGADAQLVLVLDASSSMLEADASGGTRIDAARGALTTVVDQLQPDQRVGFRVFGATVVGLDDPAACTDSQLLVPIGTDNRDQLHAAVSQYAPFGETPIGYALQQAAGDLGAEGQRSILLVSDGESNCEPDPCTVAAELAAQGINLTINVVGLNVDAVARQQLQCIASVGRGTYFDADDAQSLAAALDSLATRAFRPFSIDGTPVEGTPTAEGAPALTPGEQYTDAIAEPGVSRTYLVERQIPRSSIHVGFTPRRAWALRSRWRSAPRTATTARRPSPTTPPGPRRRGH